MPAENKTPIRETPFFVVPSDDLFFRDEGVDAYQIESVPFIAAGVEGLLDVELQQGLVHVRVCFGSERWGQSIGSPVVIDDVRYAVSLHATPVSLDDFELGSAVDNLSFSMSNLDDRARVSGLDLPRLVEPSDPVYLETRERFVRSVAGNIRELAASYPGFASGFRQAVAVLEIARLRSEQDEAWLEISRRTKAIHRYMGLVPEEMARVAPWTLSSQETDPRPVGLERTGLEVNASGVHHLTVKLVDGATFVLASLVDGTIRTEIMRS